MSNIVKETKVAVQEVSPDLNYKPIVYLKPTYRYSKLTPVTGGATQAIAVNSTRLLDFEIPSNTPINFSKSILSFTATIAAGGAGRATNIPADTCSYIQTLQLMTRGGVMIAEILNFPFHFKIMSKLGLSLREFLQNDLGQRLVRSNALIDSTAAARINNGNSSINYTEPGYLIRSGLNAAVIDPVQLHLGHIKGSFFEINKEVLFEENLLLRVTMAPASSHAFSSNDVDDPTAGNPIPSTAVTTLTALALYLCVDSDLAVLATLKHEIHQGGGLKMSMPYSQSERRLITAATTQSMSVRIAKGVGSSVLKIIQAVFGSPGAATGNLLWDQMNLNGAKVLNYYTTMNSKREMDINVSCLDADNNEDYLLNKRYLIDTCIQDNNIYQANWVHISDYTGLQNGNPLSSNVLTGMPLDQDLMWVFNASTVAADYQYFNIVIYQRFLHISPLGVQVF